MSCADGLALIWAMLLSDRDILDAVKNGRLGIQPFEDELVQPSSIDVRLDRRFRVFNNQKYTHIDPAQAAGRPDLGGRGRDDEPFVLHPGEFVLASTLEVFSLPPTSPPASKASRASAASACSPTPRPGSSTRASPGT